MGCENIWEIKYRLVKILRIGSKGIKGIWNGCFIFGNFFLWMIRVVFIKIKVSSNIVLVK